MWNRGKAETVVGILSAGGLGPGKGDNNAQGERLD